MEKQYNQKNQKMILHCVVRDVLKDLWIAVAIALSVAFIGFMAAKVSYSPSYTSSTTFVISAKGYANSAYSNMVKTQGTIDTFETLLNSQVMDKRVAEAMGMNFMPGTISVEAVPSTNLMTLSVTADRPDLAFRTLKTLLQVYPDIGDKVLGEVIMETYEPPRYPQAPDRLFNGSEVIRKVFLTALGGMLALLATLSYVRDTVKAEEEVRQKLAAPLFASVCHEKQYKNFSSFLMRRKKFMLLSEPAVSFFYEETMKKVSTKLLYKLRENQGKVVLVTSTVGEEGKSTIAMNLAQDLAHRGKKVLLIDGDLKKPSLARVMRQGRNVENGGWGVCLAEGRDPADSMLQFSQNGLRVMLNTRPFPQAADLLTSFPLARWLGAWKEQTDVIIIDGPPVRRRSDTEVWARCADASLLVVRQDWAETKYINDSIDMLEGYGAGVLGCIYNDAIRSRDYVSASYGYGYGRYGSYGQYSSYGQYGKYADSKHSREKRHDAE